jgi:hypothetical protein
MPKYDPTPSDKRRQMEFTDSDPGKVLRLAYFFLGDMTVSLHERKTGPARDDATFS